MRQSVLGLAIFGMLLAIAPVKAHHSFSAEYDSTKPTSFKGVVTKFEWMNPHVWFYVDVTDEKGNVTNWACEMGPPNGLMRSGWTKSTMKVGDEVTVEGTLAKDGAKQINSRSVTMTSTGKKFGAASSEGQNQ